MSSAKCACYSKVGHLSKSETIQLSLILPPLPSTQECWISAPDG